MRDIGVKFGVIVGIVGLCILIFYGAVSYMGSNVEDKVNSYWEAGEFYTFIIYDTGYRLSKNYTEFVNYAQRQNITIIPENEFYNMTNETRARLIASMIYNSTKVKPEYYFNKSMEIKRKHKLLLSLYDFVKRNDYLLYSISLGMMIGGSISTYLGISINLRKEEVELLRKITEVIEKVKK